MTQSKPNVEVPAGDGQAQLLQALGGAGLEGDAHGRTSSKVRRSTLWTSGSATKLGDGRGGAATRSRVILQSSATCSRAAMH